MMHERLIITWQIQNIIAIKRRFLIYINIIFYIKCIHSMAWVSQVCLVRTSIGWGCIVKYFKFAKYLTGNWSDVTTKNQTMIRTAMTGCRRSCVTEAISFVQKLARQTSYMQDYLFNEFLEYLPGNWSAVTLMNQTMIRTAMTGWSVQPQCSICWIIANICTPSIIDCSKSCCLIAFKKWTCNWIIGRRWLKQLLLHRSRQKRHHIRKIIYLVNFFHV